MKRFAFLMLLAMSVVGCGGDDSTGPSTITGLYGLRTVNGGAVPYTFLQIGNDRYELTSGNVQINTDNSFTSTMNTKTTEGGIITTDSERGAGTWTVTGNQITFKDADASHTVGTISGSELTIIDQETQISLVFRK